MIPTDSDQIQMWNEWKHNTAGSLGIQIGDWILNWFLRPRNDKCCNKVVEAITRHRFVFYLTAIDKDQSPQCKVSKGVVDLGEARKSLSKS
jgi:hypothetical protein